MRKRYLFLSMALVGVCLFMPQKSLGQSTISCGSDDGKRHSCSVDTRGGVRLLTQLSDSACTEGSSWGSDNQGIWVDHRCRADFSVGGNRDYRDEIRNDQYGGNGQSGGNGQYGGNGRQARTMACNSDDGERHSCSMDTRGGVRLLTQHSDYACTEGHSWGFDDQGVWVDHGCRADFTAGGNRDYRDEIRNGQYGENAQSQTIACKSDDMRKHSCAVDTRGSEVSLVTQHSDSPCTKGYSWGTNRHGIWVDHGCRADFAVTARYRRESGR